MSDDGFDLSSSFGTSSLSIDALNMDSRNDIDSSRSFILHESKDSLQRISPLPLLQSLFSNKPPTLYFTVEGEESRYISETSID